MPLFNRTRTDVIIVAVRFSRSGQVDWVRAFERRGPTWSDRTMIRRSDLIGRIEAGEKVVTGERTPLLASTFTTYHTVSVEQRDGIPVLVAGTPIGVGDSLAGVPAV